MALRRSHILVTLLRLLPFLDIFPLDAHTFCFILNTFPSLLTFYSQAYRLPELSQSTELPRGSRASAFISRCWAKNSPNYDSRDTTHEAGQGKATGRREELSFSFCDHLLMRRLQSRVVHSKRSRRIILTH